MEKTPTVMIPCRIRGRDYSPGDPAPAGLAPEVLSRLLESGSLSDGSGGHRDRVREELIAYIGREKAVVTPAGVMYRCVPVACGDAQARLAVERPGEFARIPGDAVYVGSGATVEDFESDIAAQLPPSPSILFIRDNGAGDVIMSTPAVREARRRLPGAKIAYATLPANLELLEGIDFVDEKLDVHELDFIPGKYDLIVNWSRAVENYSLERNRLPRIDSFAAHIGLGELADRRPEFHLAREDREFASEFLSGRGEKFVGYVMQAAAWNRTWPLWKVPQLCERIFRLLAGYKVILVDAQDESGFDAPNVINACGKTQSFKQAAALLERCELVITQDTGMAHACGAMGVKTLVLAGSIPPDRRFSGHPGVEWIHPAGRVDCCPCWDWQERYLDGEKKGELKSCHRTGKNVCLESIEPGEIAGRAKKILDTKKRHDVSVCVLTRHGGQKLENCLESLADSGEWRELLVLNNGGGAEVDSLISRYPMARAFRSGKNLGVIKGRNVLAAKAAGKYLLFLDDDQVVSPGSVRKLSETAERSGSDIVGTVLCEAGPDGIGRVVDGRPASPRMYYGGGGLLIRRDAFHELGGFDESFGMAYCEDPDLFWRARRVGFRHAWCCDAGIEHTGGSTLGEGTDFDHGEQYERSHRILRAKWPGILDLSGNKPFAILILAHDRFELFRDHVEANLGKIDPDLTEVFLLLNGVTEPRFNKYAAVLEERGIRVFRSLDNLSCSPGRKHLLGKVLDGGKHEYFMFLDDDMMITEPGFERKIIRRFGEHPATGCVQGLIFEGGGNQLGAARYAVGGEMNSTTLKVSRKADRKGPAAGEEAFIPAASGGFCAIRRGVARRFSGYLDRFPAGFGDFDLSFRIRAAGYRILFAPEVAGIHHPDKSAWRDVPGVLDSTLRMKAMWGIVHEGAFEAWRNSFDEWADRHLGVTVVQLMEQGFRNAREYFDRC